MTRATLCAALLLALFGPAAARELPLSRLLKRTLDAYGGASAVAKFPAKREEGQVTSAQRGGAVGKLSRVFGRPRKLRVEVAFPGEDPEIRILDGARGWRGGAEVSGTPNFQAMVLQAARLDLPLILVEGRMKLVDGGTVKRGKKNLRLVTLPLDRGMSLSAEIDPSSGLILRSSGRIENGSMGQMEFVTTYDDFRRVDGVLVPFREGNFADGESTGDTVLERVEFLRRPPDEGFKP